VRAEIMLVNSGQICEQFKKLDYAHADFLARVK
jgi:hypothetical protein